MPPPSPSCSPRREWTLTCSCARRRRKKRCPAKCSGGRRPTVQIGRPVRPCRHLPPAALQGGNGRLHVPAPGAEGKNAARRSVLVGVARRFRSVDPFGHAATFPQLLSKAGMDAYMFLRPAPKEKTLPGEVFWWASPDGSDR